MRRFLLDSGITSAYINRRHGVYERAQLEVNRGNRIGLGTPVLGELLAGIQLSATQDENLRRFRRQQSAFVLWPFDAAAAEQFAPLFADLRRRGRMFQIVDIQIAAIALSLGNTSVVSADSDLTTVPGLTVENWIATET